MPEFRQDPLTRRWVIIAEGRAGRPYEFISPEPSRKDEACPFCAGNEHETPTAVANYSMTEASGTWDVRVVPNKFPAVTNATVKSATAESDCSCRGILATGIHEVIIESRRHVISLSELTDDECGLVFRVYQDRLRTLVAAKLAYGLVFKNALPEAGASLEHIHSQLIALPFIPPDVVQRQQVLQRQFEQHGNCLLCDMVREAEDRLVASTANLVAICPYASRFAYETWILPRAHHARFEQSEHAVEVAQLMRSVIQRMERALDQPAYNYLIQTAPFDSSKGDYYHWHMEVFPRLTKCAGFEWASGCFINPVSPENAAEHLRQVASDD